MEAFDTEMGRWAWAQLWGLMDRHHVQRGHVTAGDVSERAYDKLRKAQFRPDEHGIWLNQLWILLCRVNHLIQFPPRDSEIPRGTATSWSQLFGGRPEFPASPDRRGEAPMDAGAAELGARWKSASFMPYEAERERECRRFAANGDASKRRQVIEKLAALYEATGKWQRAVPCLQELREINVVFGDDGFLADCDLRLGIAYYRSALWDEAEAAIRSGSEVIERRRDILGNSKTELRLRGYLGLVRMRRNHPREALRIFDAEVRPLVEMHKSTYVTATFRHRRALIYESLEDFQHAHED